MIRGVQLPIPDVTGLTLKQARTAIEANGFEFADGGPTPSAAEPGMVECTSPTGSATRGALITVFISDGSLAAAEPDPGEGEGEGPPSDEVLPRPTTSPAGTGSDLGTPR